MPNASPMRRMPVPDRGGGVGELPRVVGAERQLGRRRPDRLEPHGVGQAVGQRRVVQVEQAETGDLVDHLRLLQPAPVLVLALHHRLGGGPAQPEPFAQDRDHRADREVPEPDDGVHRPVERLDLPLRGVQQPRQVDRLPAGQLAVGQQRVEAVAVGVGQAVQEARVVGVEPEHEHVLRHAARLLHRLRGSTDVARPVVPMPKATGYRRGALLPARAHPRRGARRLRPGPPEPPAAALVLLDVAGDAPSA